MEGWKKESKEVGLGSVPFTCIHVFIVTKCRSSLPCCLILSPSFTSAVVHRYAGNSEDPKRGVCLPTTV